MRTEAEKKVEREAYKMEAEKAQAAYDNFRYTDAQREQTIEFIGAAMKVIRGEAEFDSLKRLLPVIPRAPANNLTPAREIHSMLGS